MPTSNALSNHGESGILSWIYRGGDISRPTTIAVALCSDIPTDAATGASMFEVPNAGSYARVAYTQSNANWSYIQEAGGSGFIANNSEITFPQVTAAWGHISGLAFVDSTTYGQGNVYHRGSLETPKYVDVDEQLVIRVSGIRIRIS